MSHVGNYRLSILFGIKASLFGQDPKLAEGR